MEKDENFMIKSLLKFISRLFIVRKTASSGVHLTYDDGPHKTNTDLILDLLSAGEHKASFFLVGQEIEKFPDVAKRIQREGHSLGYHSYSHLHAKDVGFFATWNDLKKATEIEQKYQLDFAKRYRPPFGALTIPTLLAILLRGWKIHLWSLDSLDSYVDTQGVLNQLSPDKISAGEIILLHDDGSASPDTLRKLLSLYISTKISLQALN